MMITNSKFKQHPAVFYKCYNGKAVLYHTGLQKVFYLNEVSKDILDCFKDWKTETEAIEVLKNIYKVDDLEEFQKLILDFVNKMMEKEVLIKYHTQKEIKENLETQITAEASKDNQLLSATFELTYKCNEKCRHCYISASDKPELSTEKIKAVLDELANLNVLNVVFTGGELFVRKDIWEILSYAYTKHFVIDIFTNGNLLSTDDIIKLKSIWPRSVHFSLYSHIAEKHDAITQISGSFEKTLKAIKLCKLVGIPVNIKTPIFNETVNDVKNIIELANELGVSIEIGKNITPKKDGNLSPLSMKIEDEMSDYMVHCAIHDSIDMVEDKKKELPLTEKICGAGEHSISINPYGEVFPCNMLQLKIGDLNSETLEQIWHNSEKLKWWRKNNVRANKKGCENCKYSYRCIFCPGEAMMRNNNPLQQYDAACISTRYAVNRESRKEGENI